MKKNFISLLLVVATGVIFGQNAVEVSYNWERENHICVTANPLNLVTIMQGEWSGPGVVENVFYPATVPVGSTIKLICGNREFFVRIQAIPYASLGWVPKEVKVGSQQIELTGYPAGGTWAVNGKTFDGKFNPENVGTYEVIYMLTDEYGCTSGVVEHIVVK